MATYILTAAQLNNRILNSFSIPAASAVPTVSDPNAQAFLNAAVITDVTQANAINTLVIGLKADGLWTPMQALYPFVGGTATQHKYNLKDPRDLDDAYRIDFSGGEIHNSNGVIFNGINGAGNTHYVNFQTGELGAYSRGGTLLLGGNYSPSWQGGDYPVPWSPFIILSANTGDVSGIFSNSNDFDEGFAGFPPNANLGLLGLSGGLGAGVNKIYKNGVEIASKIPSTSTDPLPFPLFLGSQINAGSSPYNASYANSQLAFAFITTTVLNQTQNTNLYNRIQTFQTALSRQV
jgi:hypothetical protein